MTINPKHVAICVVVTALLGPRSVIAELPPPDATLWTTATNPSGTNPVPVVAYDPATGVVSVDTRGWNRVDDTGSNGSFIGGDDVGFISIAFESPAPDSFQLEGLRGTQGAGTNWAAAYFNGKTQLVGIADLDEYLLPIGVTPIVTFSGITDAASEFGKVEMGLNFQAGAAGDTIFGSIQVVPEPSGVCLVSTALLGLLAWLKGWSSLFSGGTIGHVCVSWSEQINRCTQAATSCRFDSNPIRRGRTNRSTKRTAFRCGEN
jgi:hypothetical protein